MVGGELEMENYSGWLQMDNCCRLRTDNDSGRLYTKKESGEVQGRTTVVGCEIQTDNGSGLKRQWWASDGER